MSPVGEAILADTDGDNEDEIVVTAADGYLYGIDQQIMAAPEAVYDNDGRGPAMSAATDVDTLVTIDTLYGNWSAVGGASRYEYAVLSEDGVFLTSPDFVDAGTATEAAPGNLTLSAGHRYFFAVRAVGPQGTSVERLSDGVVVVSDPCNACGAGTECVQGLCVSIVGGSDGGTPTDNDNIDAGPRPAEPASCSACGPGTRCVRGLCVGTDADEPPSGGKDAVRAGGGGSACVIANSANPPLRDVALLLLCGCAFLWRRSALRVTVS